MPIAFHPPTHAPQGATPAHARRDLDDDASTADAFTLLLLAASSVDEPMAAEDATPSLAADAGIPGTPAGPLAADAAAPVVPALAVTAGADPALEAVRAAATAAGALPPVQPSATLPGVVTIVSSERIARAGGAAARAEPSTSTALAAGAGAAMDDAKAFDAARRREGDTPSAASDGAESARSARAEVRADAQRSSAAAAGVDRAAGAAAAATAAGAASAAADFARRLSSLDAPADDHARPGRAAPGDTPMALTAIDGTYLRAAAHAPGIAVATIATPAFTPGWQDEAVGRMAHVILSRNERAELTLHPAELGPVSIRVDLAADQASLTIVAESAATRSALEQSLPQLRDLLASQGITLGQASVHDGSARRDDARAPAASATKPGRDAAPSAPVVATTWVVRPSNGRVDVFA